MQLFKVGAGYEAAEGTKRLRLNDVDVRLLKHKAARIDFTNVPELIITDATLASSVLSKHHKQQRANAYEQDRIMTLVKEGNERTFQAKELP